MRPAALHPVALSHGQRPEANRLLQDYVAHHPLDEEAWFRLSQSSDEPAVGTECLVRVLEIRAAHAGLPGGHTALASRLRRLADTVERPPRSLQARRHAVLTWAGRALLAGVLIVVALVVGPLALGARPITILSGSMEPFIHTGSIVVAQPVPSASLRVGDVIAYLPGANAAVPVVHRIVTIRDEDGTRFYTTRGDANASNDPNEVPLGATAWRHWYSVPVTGYLVAFAASANGKLAMIGLPLLGLAGLSVADWLKRQPVALPTQRWLRLPIQPSLARLRALLTRPRLTIVPAPAAPLAQSALAALQGLTTLVALVRPSALRARRELLCLPDRVGRLRLPVPPALAARLRQTARRTRRELRELRELMRLPAPSALRELYALLRLSILRELHALRRQPTLRRLRAQLRQHALIHLRTRLRLP